MFNLKQDDDIDKNLIKENKLVWCRLMFAIYIKLSNGHFERVSPTTYTDLIEDSRIITVTNSKLFLFILAHSSQSLDFKTVFPDKFCERGGQIIFIQLEEELVEKDGM
jgi:hypothetical protein